MTSLDWKDRLAAQIAQRKAEAVALELLAALKLAEAKMSKSPEFNAWDLGPGKTLKAIRAVIAKAET